MLNILKTSLLLLFGSFLLSCEDFLPKPETGNNEDLDPTETPSDSDNPYVKFSLGLEQNIKTMDGAMQRQVALLENTAIEKLHLAAIAKTAGEISEKTAGVSLLIDELCAEIRQRTDNLNQHLSRKSITKIVLLESSKATQLKEELMQNKKTLLQGLDELVQQHTKEPMQGTNLIVESIETLKNQLHFSPVYNDNWEEDNFGGLSAAEAYTQLRKIQSDSKNAALQIIYFLSDQMGSKTETYNKFELIATAEKPYIILGETYEAEIGFGAMVSEAEYAVSVNGSPLRVEDAKAKYSARPGSVGTQAYKASLTVVNPLTGERENVQKEFKYEVAVPSVSISADNMNTLYIGVDNPLSVAASGVSSNDVMVKLSGAGGATLTDVVRGKYDIQATKKTMAGEYCMVEIWNKRTNQKLAAFPFRVKAIPDPAVLLSNKSNGGVIKAAEMQEQEGLITALDYFDFDVKCQIQSFTLHYIAPRQDAVSISNTGADFTGKTLAAIKAAKPGTAYLFTDVKGRCPGDATARNLNGLAFQVR